MRRVVVTGLGAVSPVGNDVAESWSALLAGRSGIARIRLWDPTGLPVQIAGEVKDFDPSGLLPAKELRRASRNVRFALAAGAEAFRDAGVEPGDLEADRAGCIVGTALGGVDLLAEQQQVLLERGPQRISPFFVPEMISDVAAAHVAMRFGLRGHNCAIVSACASGGHAIGEAAEAIRRGEADVMVAGGTDAGIVPVIIAGLAAMRALTCAYNDDPSRASRPFDAARSGFVSAEGAAALILEDLGRARRRGARIYAEYAGYGSSNDAFHLTAPRPDGSGAAAAMSRALAKARVDPVDVGYINAHGTSTPLNDWCETAAIKSVFGAHAGRVPVSSTKSMTGHMMGAGGAFEAVVSILAIYHGVIPPTINYEHPDPDCDLDYVPNQPRERPVGVALSNSFGLGGHNSCLVFRRFALP